MASFGEISRTLIEPAQTYTITQFDTRFKRCIFSTAEIVFLTFCTSINTEFRDIIILYCV